jgi:type VI secretion system protein ImpJ
LDDQQKVLWSEGMFLTPHHFQQHDRHQAADLAAHLRAMQDLGWGFSDLKIDEDALAVGDFVVSRCVGVLQDGLAFSCPDRDDLPPTRQLGGIFDTKGAIFDAKRSAVSVYLAIPLVRPGIAATSAEGQVDGAPTRYRSTTVTVRDENNASAERQLVVAKKTLRILFEGESRDNYSWLKIAEIGRGESGRITLSTTYIPPCLHLAASARLQVMVRRGLEMLTGRSTELSAQRRHRGSGVVDFALSETANFALLQLINLAIPAIRHCHSQPGTHPERAYLELARLAGGLFTFAAEGHPKDLPLYVHDDLSGTFEALAEQLSHLLNVVLPVRCTRIPLQQIKETLFTGEVPRQDDEQDPAAFYLAVFASVRPEKLVGEVPLKAKIATPDAIDFLVAQAVRGLGLSHLPSPPPELPVNPDWQYFKLQNVGEQWKEVQSAGRIAFHLPPEFKGLRLEFLMVRG